MRLLCTRFWTFIFLLLSTLTTVRMEAQSSLKDSTSTDSAYAIALRQYHSYVAPEVGLYRGIQYVDYDYTIQRGQPFFGSDSSRFGSIWYDGVRYDHVRMLYDLVKDQLVILDPYNAYKISIYMDLVDSFTLDKQPFVRIGDSLAPSTLRTGFWEPLYRGRVVLLKREKKLLHENIAIPADGVRLFIDDQISYYLKKGSGYHAVNNRKELFDIYKDRRSELKKLIRKSGFRWRTDKEQLLQLVSAWDSDANH